MNNIREKKIFIIGFNKTGTKTINEFFSLSGVPSLHWGKGTIAIIMKKRDNMGLKLLNDKYERTYILFSDMEYHLDLNYAHVKYYKKLEKQYPNAKFILNIRDKEKWIKSRNNHLNGKYADDLMKIYNLNLSQLNEKWRKEYDEHISDVKRYFADKNHKLIIFDIEKDNIEKLIEFFPEYNLNKNYYKHYNKT